MLAQPDYALGSAQRARQRKGTLALLGAQVGVARAHRQAVRLADGRSDLDPHGEVQVVGELADDERLLGVFLAEVRDVRPGHVEEFGHDGGDPLEVTGAGGAVEWAGQPADLDARIEALGIDLLDRRREQDVDALALGQPGVVLFVARVRVEVFGRAELCRVDEQRHDDGCALLACGAHQRQMALVEPAHRGHQADGARRDGERTAQLGDRADRLHAATSRVC